MKLILIIYILILYLIAPVTNIEQKIHNNVLPKYAYRLITKFRLDPVLMENWSFAESSHCKNATEHGYYGRYNIGTNWLIDYCRWRGRSFDSIKDIKKFLKNDKNNCYIAYWSCRYFQDYLGYTYKQFFQIWLWGFGNYHKGHYSYSYERKIFK